MTATLIRTVFLFVMSVVPVISGCQTSSGGSAGAGGLDGVISVTGNALSSFKLSFGLQETTKRTLEKQVAVDEKAILFGSDSGLYIYLGMLRDPLPLGLFIENSSWFTEINDEFARRPNRQRLADMMQQNINGYRMQNKIIITGTTELGEYNHQRKGFQSQLVKEYRSYDVLVGDGPWFSTNVVAMRMDLHNIDGFAFISMDEAPARRLVQSFNESRARGVSVIIVAEKVGARHGKIGSRGADKAITGVMEFKVTKVVYHIDNNVIYTASAQKSLNATARSQ